MKTNTINPINQRVKTAPKALLTLGQLSIALGVCEATIRNWKGCPRVVIGKRKDGRGKGIRFHLDTVLAWLNEKRNA